MDRDIAILSPQTGLLTGDKLALRKAVAVYPAAKVALE